MQTLPSDWQAVLAEEMASPSFQSLRQFLATERAEHAVYPPENEVFNALVHTPLSRVRVVLLGQDPYHQPGQAHGLCFSVRPGVSFPPSLRNISKELHDDVGCAIPTSGTLMPWADKGVLLLNAVLTVRANEPNSHKNRGWEQFTDAILRGVAAQTGPIVFLLWGAYAQKKADAIESRRHVVLRSAHPSPLSARKFFGSKPFSATNAALERAGLEPIDWRLKGK